MDSLFLKILKRERKGKRKSSDLPTPNPTTTTIIFSTRENHTSRDLKRLFMFQLRHRLENLALVLATYNAPSVRIFSLPHGSSTRLVGPAKGSQLLLPLIGPGLGMLTPLAP